MYFILFCFGEVIYHHAQPSKLPQEIAIHGSEVLAKGIERA